MEEALKEFVEEMNRTNNERIKEINKDDSEYLQGYYEGKYDGMLEINNLLMYVGYTINWNKETRKYQLFKRVDRINKERS